MNESTTAGRRTNRTGVILRIVGLLALVAAAMALLRFAAQWSFFDALLVTGFAVTGLVLIADCVASLFYEKTLRHEIRGRWVFGVCAAVCVALGMLQTETSGLTFFGLMALLNLCSFVKPPRAWAAATPR